MSGFDFDRVIELLAELRPLDAQAPEVHPLLDGGHAVSPGMQGIEHVHHVRDTQAVRIRLDHDHQSSLRPQQAPEGLNVVGQRGAADLNPTVGPIAGWGVGHGTLCFQSNEISRSIMSTQR